MQIQREKKDQFDHTMWGPHNPSHSSLLSPHSSVFFSQSHHDQASPLPPSLSSLALFLSPREASPSSPSPIAPIAFGLYREGLDWKRSSRRVWTHPKPHLSLVSPTRFPPPPTPTPPPPYRIKCGEICARDAVARQSLLPLSFGTGSAWFRSSRSLRWLRWVLACGLELVVQVSELG